MQPGVDFTATPAYQALSARLRAIERRLTPIQQTAYAARERRFRLASATAPLLVNAGGTVTVNVTFSNPMPTTDYQVDVTVPSILGPVSNVAAPTQDRTLTGCKVTFTVPAILALGATVIVLAISPPQTS